MDSERRRAEIAWILWCANEGYLLAEDRAAIDNWFLSGTESTDHPDDNRRGWLEAADAVIAALADPKPHDSGKSI